MAGIDVLARIKFWGYLALFITASFLPGKAVACIALELQRSIFFEAGDLAVDAPIIADVSLLSKSWLPDRRLLLTARVNRIFRGRIDGNQIIITLIPTSCHLGTEVGTRGIVAGRMIRGPDGSPEFEAIVESLGERERRRRPAAAPSTR